MNCRSYREPLVLALLLALAAPTLAQVGGPRTLPELKAEIQERADRRAYPVSGLDPSEVKEALRNLKTLGRDEWSQVWSALGDRHMTNAKTAPGAAAAVKDYRYAFEYYLFARFPLENSPGKVKAYEKALEAFAAYAKLQNPPIETVRIPFDETPFSSDTRRASSTWSRR